MKTDVDGTTTAFAAWETRAGCRANTRDGMHEEDVFSFLGDPLEQSAYLGPQDPIEESRNVDE
jgi:hypothetical protein